MALLEHVDIWLFRLLNLSLVHPALDDLMVFLTTPKLSGHILLLIALFVLVRAGKSGMAILLLVFASLGLADFIASGLLKPLVQRIRPCFALDHVRLLINQPHSFSFASSHAANAAAVASMLWIFFHRGVLVEKLFTAIIIFYACAIAFSRAYTGVHYPSDLLAGMIIGIGSATFIYLLFSWVLKNIVQPWRMRQNRVE